MFYCRTTNSHISIGLHIEIPSRSLDILDPSPLSTSHPLRDTNVDSSNRQEQQRQQRRSTETANRHQLPDTVTTNQTGRTINQFKSIKLNLNQSNESTTRGVTRQLTTGDDEAARVMDRRERSKDSVGRRSEQADGCEGDKEREGRQRRARQLRN